MEMLNPNFILVLIIHNDLGDVGNLSRPTEDGSQAVHLNHHFKTTDLPQPVDIFLNFC
jgi:hypothetical protein